ncbi:putative serine esterase-domain-containing protein [Stachybotrys elegans]|uniref:Serine esterase-domain-containing protein n=1 Tax=Stachybotrys elegans TaxID=80388 RepID=A0A8K0SY82_9HYPO|nr:putative serine esterase-domain-containing protein [Stachybotrys elegans]
MLLLHQVGSLKIGEVVRYTVTYTPSQDRILPPPEKLYVRLRNTSAVALRAAFVHGPYTLSVAAYPSNYDPNHKFHHARTYGIPEFEPMVKAGGSWECELVVPEHTRQVAGTRFQTGTNNNTEHHESESASWIIEVSSQVIFSTSAAVGYEVIVAREKKSLSLSHSLPVVGGQAQVPQPGKVSDLQQSVGAHDGHHPAQQKGVFSRAVHVKVEDTASLWNTPALPGWDEAGSSRVKARSGADEPVESVDEGNHAKQQAEEGDVPRKPKKVHLVVLTHGLHSNLGADMLYMKESIDAAVRQAKIDAKTRRAKERAARRERKQQDTPASPGTGEEEEKESETAKATSEQNPRLEQTVPHDNDDNEDDNEDDEEVIVRGYSGNATKTEKGIKYLGKRLARYVLSMTYPDQPYMPVGKGAGEGLNHHSLLGGAQEHDMRPAHKHSDIVENRKLASNSHHHHLRAYKITSISFIAHSLGGLVQTYAIAYIQKHSPQFFDLIKPINFIALATPYLGLSNENPLYVKFALDFGLVGRTGQDLGLTWRAPTIARSGWGALVSNLGEAAHKRVYGETQPESKPLLRILPTGPAHTALKKFRNRTVYSNVVNDGIVPLRTSCLLFLDWQGLGRVEKARRDAGLVETVVGFGWAELTGASMTSPRLKQQQQQQQQKQPEDDDLAYRPASSGSSLHEVPQPPQNAVVEDERASIRSVTSPYGNPPTGDGESASGGPLSGFFNFFKSNEPPKGPTISPKQQKIYHMSQTTNGDESSLAPTESSQDGRRSPRVTTGHELEDDPLGVMTAPPRTTFFESAGDVLNPKIPDVAYLLDPSKRPRTIFHDRVYHPSDMPPPPLKKRSTPLIRRKTLPRIHSSSHKSVDSDNSSAHASLHPQDSPNSSRDYDDAAFPHPDKGPDEVVDSSSLRVEEKIARGYHRDLSWRKVLVKLEPDAHNNIIVRRMFANAYGWPVIKHLVDVHFSDAAVARRRDEDERVGERALDVGQPPTADGGETKGEASNDDASGAESGNASASASARVKREEEALEARDQVPDLPTSQEGETATAHGIPRPGPQRCDSMTWSDHDWADSEYDSDGEHHGEIGTQSKGKEPERSASPSWNWTEKIVGKGAANRAKSPVQAPALK